MGETEVVRSRGTQVLGAVMVVVALVGIGSAATDGVPGLLRFAAPLALFGLLGYEAFWRPQVEVSDGGVRVTNPGRTVQVPWPAVESVDGRYGLRLRTAYGALSAWAAPAPVGKQRARGEQSPAAVLVERRLADLREAGHLRDARLERDELPTTWHLPVLVAAGLLVLASAVLPLLA